MFARFKRSLACFKFVLDQRVSDWFLMSSVWPTVFVAAFYLLLVYGFLPAYMKNRKPYHLTTTIRIYNISQIAICSWIIYWVSSQSKKVVNKKTQSSIRWLHLDGSKENTTFAVNPSTIQTTYRPSTC